MSDNPFTSLAELLKSVSGEGLDAATNAAAEVYKRAITDAAPRASGVLAASVGIFESRDKRQLSGDNLRRVLVGPDKKKGFYGFFLEKGWTHTGRARKTRDSSPGRAAHGQKGTARTGKKISGNRWFTDAVAGANEAAEKAAADALESKIKEIDSRL
jgi:hypothetical protein